MRKGVDGLAMLVRQSFDEDVFSGHLFCFLSRRRDRVKILWRDHGGSVVYYKRLDKGRFRRPYLDPDGDVTLTTAELHSVLEGIDFSKAKRASLWSPKVPTSKSIDTASRL